MTVTLVVTVESNEDRSPIPAARVHDSIENLFGITLLNGNVSFEVRLDSGGSNRELRLVVTALGFISMAATVKLTPQSEPFSVLVVLAPRQIVNIGLASSAIALRLSGDGVALTAPARSFVADGSEYNGVVQFSGMAGEGDTISPSFFPSRYEVNQTQYGIIYVVFPEFVDNEMGKLEVVRPLTIAINLDLNALGGRSVSLLIFNETSNLFEFGGNLVQLDESARKKRQADRSTETFIMPGIPVGIFFVIATTINAECWLQARTFSSGIALSNGFVILDQRFEVGTRNIMYRFGTNTGVDANFNDNAVCLPLACNGFNYTTVIGRPSFQSDAELTPVEFNETTFATIDNMPIIIGNSFYFESLVVASVGQPKPFYPNRTACESNAEENDMTADPSDFFSFEQDDPNPIVTGECYIRVRVRDCYDANIVNVRSFDSDTNALNRDESVTMTMADVNMTIDMDFPSGDMDMCLEADAVLQSACVPFTCSNIIMIQTQFDPERVTRDGPIPINQQFCNITAMAPNLAPIILTTTPGSTATSTVSFQINTNLLRMDDYNDPMLGLYYNSDSTMAKDLCQNVMNTMPAVLDGSAVTYNCVEEPAP